MTRAAGIKTRLARAADTEKVDRLLAAYREEMGAPPRAPVELDLGGEGPLFLVVAEHPSDSELAGMLAAHRCHNFMHAADFLLLTDIYVPAAQRRAGVAGALMQEVEVLARELECTSMSIIVAHINDAALTTAARSGFLRHDELLISRQVG